jgi:hypothetical protein
VYSGKNMDEIRKYFIEEAKKRGCITVQNNRQKDLISAVR